MPHATSLHPCLKNKQLILNSFRGKDPAKEYLILCTLMRGVANTWTTHPCSLKSEESLVSTASGSGCVKTHEDKI